MSSIQKSSVLNNEPTLSASDFDKKLLSFVKDYCSPFDDIRKCLADVRIAATVEKETKGQDLPSWPLDTCYVNQQCVIDLYNIASVGAKLAGDPSLLNDESLILDMLIEPTILGGCFAWDKVRNIIHVNNKQFDNSLLDCPCASLAKLPQWAICFNTLKNDIFWNDRPVAGVIFFHTFSPTHPTEILGLPFIEDNGLEGDPLATFNKLNSLVIYHDGNIDLGPHIDLCDYSLVKNSLENNSKGIQELAQLAQLNQQQLSEDPIHMANGYIKESYAIFNLLVYFLENLDKLKNEKGEKVSFAPNPEPFKTKKGYRLFGSDRISPYYLD